MRSRGHRRAFSLLELIVIVAVLGVLAALAIPAVQRSGAQADSAKCLANLRQIGVGLGLYLNDHAMIMPDLRAGRASADEDLPVIDVLLAEYLDDPAVFTCPADDRFAKETGTSYYWNVALNGQHAANLNFLQISDTPGSIPVLSDKEGWHRFRDNKVNFLYADGHAGRDLRLFTGP